MKILFLTDNFPPETTPPASRSYEHIREWVSLGHEVTVITSFPNFPFGKVYDGYKNKLWQVEDIDGIKVIRVWTFIAENKGFLLRIIDFISFMFSSFLAGLFLSRPQIIIGTSPQFFTVCSSWALAKIKSVPWVFELRDIWPESLKAVDLSKNVLLIRVFEKIEIFLYKSADIIISVTHSFKSALIKRGIDGNKIYVVTNGVDISKFKMINKDQALLSKYDLIDKFVVSYIGTHGMAHSLETIIDAAKELEKKFKYKDIIFVLLGSGSEKKKLESYTKKIGAQNILMLDPVERDQIYRYWSITDLAVVHLKDDDLFKTVIPSKIFESMSMGIPIALGVKGETKKIIEDSKSGIYFEPENSSDLCNLVIRLYEDKYLLKKYKVNASKAAKTYNRENLAKNMLKILENLEKTNK